MENNTKSLQKKIKADMICSFVAAFSGLSIALVDFLSYINGAGSETLSNGFYAVLVGGIGLILGFILLEVHKMGKPFSRNIIHRLRILALFIIIGGLLPEMLASVIVNLARARGSGFVVEVVFTLKNVVISVIGVVIGVVSEIFAYGHILQEDVDSIA